MAGFLLMLASACSHPPHLVVYQTDTEWVDLREMPAGYADLPPHNHPITLSQKEVQGVLHSVFYRQSTIFSFVFGKPQPVFTDYQLTLLSHEISRGLDQALPQEIVAFRVRQEPNAQRYTEGWCFIQEHDMHLVIEQIKFPAFQSPEMVPQPNPPRWELAPRESQHLFTTGSENKGLRSNWIILPVPTLSQPHS